MAVLHGFVIIKNPHHCWRGPYYSNNRGKITSNGDDDDANGNDGDDASDGPSGVHPPIQPWR